MLVACVGAPIQPWVSHVGWLLLGKLLVVVSIRENVEG